MTRRPLPGVTRAVGAGVEVIVGIPGNMGQGGASSGRGRTAYELRHRFQWLNQFTDDELRDMAFCDERSPLQEGGQYFDISHPERGTIVASNAETVPEGSCYVWRGNVSDHTWQKMVGYGRMRETGR